MIINGEVVRERLVSKIHTSSLKSHMNPKGSKRKGNKKSERRKDRRNTELENIAGDNLPTIPSIREKHVVKKVPFEKKELPKLVLPDIVKPTMTCYTESREANVKEDVGSFAHILLPPIAMSSRLTSDSYPLLLPSRPEKQPSISSRTYFRD